MDRSTKTELVARMREVLTQSSLIIVTQQTGLTVGEATDLRRKVREAGADFKVLKNTLAHIAIQETPLSGLSPFLKGPTALAYSKDPVAAAKVIVQFAKKNSKLTVVGGSLDGQVLNREGIQALAELPSLDGLRSMLLAVISAPATKIALTTKEVVTQLARVIGAKANS